jgi:hypothetical protein
MTKVIEFHIPPSYKPKRRWIPIDDRGKVIAFTNVLTRKSAWEWDVSVPRTQEFGPVPRGGLLRQGVLDFLGKHLPKIASDRGRFPKPLFISTRKTTRKPVTEQRSTDGQSPLLKFIKSQHISLQTQ